jgi:hypothetical protein
MRKDIMRMGDERIIVSAIRENCNFIKRSITIEKFNMNTHQSVVERPI